MTRKTYTLVFDDDGEGIVSGWIEELGWKQTWVTGPDPSAVLHKLAQEHVVRQLKIKEETSKQS